MPLLEQVVFNAGDMFLGDDLLSSNGHLSANTAEGSTVMVFLQLKGLAPEVNVGKPCW